MKTKVTQQIYHALQEAGGLDGSVSFPDVMDRIGAEFPDRQEAYEWMKYNPSSYFNGVLNGWEIVDAPMHVTGDSEYRHMLQTQWKPGMEGLAVTFPSHLPQS